MSTQPLPLWYSAFLQSLRGYRLQDLRADLLAGVTVGIVAVPLAMALAIASGVPPQYGLYTSIIAGAIIALSGGSRFNISGPTAAFVVILLPITEQHGLGGLLLTTVMAGIILVLMGVGRMGRLIQYIPYPVTTGFTAGIAVVIATLQLQGFFGLETGPMPQHYLEKVATLIDSLPSLQWADTLIALFTLAVLILWPRLKTAIPGHLVALTLGALLAWLLGKISADFSVATIGSQFHYTIDGQQGQGIPPLPPQWVLPWRLPNANGEPIGISWELVRTLLPAAFTVAMLGAIESLLCAVVADGLTGQKHRPDNELVGQGLGNIIAPFFGGIPATAAIARTATNIRTGARSPVAALIHAGVVLLAVVTLAGLLAFVPMASLAALLLVVAWNMSEAKHFVRILKVAPRCDILVLLTCFSLTVIFDMVIAVSAGVVLAAFLFIRRISALSGGELLEPKEHEHLSDLPDHVIVYDINGPMFFGAAEKALNTLNHIHGRTRVVILDMGDVPMMDMTGIVALQSIINNLQQRGISVMMMHLLPRIREKLETAGIREQEGGLCFCEGFAEAREKSLELGR